jgi:methylenetetrahydrofolate dehydrogenase (NADP+)/methenyltetrahydrofolate cyclohydrolase
MKTVLLDGKVLCARILEELRKERLQSKKRMPLLVAVLTDDNPASLTYVTKKAACCKAVGFDSRVLRVAPRSTEELISTIAGLNEEKNVDGILLQLPVPAHIDLMRVIEHIDPRKDVDGFHPINVGKVMLGQKDAFYPCTPLGIQALLEHYGIAVEGKHVVIVGRSNIVGKPLAAMLLQNAPRCNATVTVAHSATRDLAGICRTADILVAATGKPLLITRDMVKQGAVVVDVGITKVADPSKKSGFRLVGDVDFQAVFPEVSAITPVPGGVGPMTIAMLLKNTYKAYCQRQMP